MKESNAAVSAAADALLALLNNGYLRIYDGTQPADANTAITTQVLLCELRWNATAFAPAAIGVAAANTIASAVILATGTATWFRALKADGTTVVFDGTAAASAADLILGTDTLVADGSYQAVDSFTYTQPKG